MRALQPQSLSLCPKTCTYQALGIQIAPHRTRAPKKKKVSCMRGRGLARDAGFLHASRQLRMGLSYPTIFSSKGTQNHAMHWVRTLSAHSITRESSRLEQKQGVS